MKHMLSVYSLLVVLLLVASQQQQYLRGGKKRRQFAGRDPNNKDAMPKALTINYPLNFFNGTFIHIATHYYTTTSLLNLLNHHLRSYSRRIS